MSFAYCGSVGENTLIRGEMRPDDIVQRLVDITEADMMAHDDPKYGHPGRFGGSELGGFCRPASEVFEYYANEGGHRTHTYQNRDIHAFFGKETDPDGPIHDRSFGHALNIAEIGGQYYLVDLTFGQFCAGDTVRHSEILSNHPLARRLVEHCYAPLTDETLREYLMLTAGTDAENRGYVHDATVDALLSNVKPLERVYPTDQIASGEMWHPNSCAERVPPCSRPEPLTKVAAGAAAMALAY